MSNSKLTLIGFYNWMNANDEDLFVNLQPPSAVDRDALVNNILLRGGEFEVLYSDPEFLQAAIAPWNTKWLPTMNKWVNALSIEYDPLYNYDRHEEWTEENENSVNVSNTKTIDTDTTDSVTTSGTTSGTGSTTSTSTSGTEEKVSAYNSNSYQPNKTVDVDAETNTTDTTSGTSSGTENGTGTIDTTETQTGTNTGSSSGTRTGRAYGNIGVTTTQQMLEQELEIARFNLIDQITDLFLAEFVIPIY